MREKTGFTLAEVLVTLVVIGVVASLTIPALLQNYKKLEYVTRLQKNYKILTEVVSMIQAENDGSLTGFANNNDEVKDAFLKYVRYIDDCDSGSCLGNLWYDNASASSKILNGTSYTTWSGSPTIKFQDGVAWTFWDVTGSDCSQVQGSLGNICFQVGMDVNGIEKDPNTIGRDIFAFYVTKDKVLPMGASSDDPQTGTCNTSSSGWGCAGKIILDGWKMDY